MTFEKQSWPEIADFMSGMATNHPEYRHMADIVDSIVASGVSDQLAGHTSMHDLHVVQSPVQAEPHDPIVVRSPGSLRRPATGTVVIEHHASTGRVDCIERPAGEAVPLFWRFVVEKFGVQPQQGS